MVAVILSMFLPAQLCAQTASSASAELMGVVRDSHGMGVPDAIVSLENRSDSHGWSKRTDSNGSYKFAPLAAGSYTIRAELTGKGRAQFGPFALNSGEGKTIDLTLSASPPPKAVPEFDDEPKFTVSGITQTGNSGGHGSDTMQRTSDALAKATVSLSNSRQSSVPTSSSADLKHRREEIQAQLTRDDRAELHHQLAEIDEKLANPLDAVQEYQRAAEMNPSEPYLFDWGSELLAHRALEPAAEVFAKGHRLFPKSSRMLIGFAVVRYTQGSYDKALQHLFEASDLDPSDATAYLFLGKIQALEAIESQGLVEKFRRFARLQPQSALANYYYAVSLWKQSRGEQKSDNSEQVQSLLEKAILLDPKLGEAHLQLGIVFFQKSEFEKAMVEYQKALEDDENLLEAHYRLGQAYRRTGQIEKAQQEMQLHEELSKKSAEQAERERQEIQQFVVTLRDGTSKPDRR
jgi:tetratricopeptide (TPR) repeat protein